MSEGREEDGHEQSRIENADSDSEPLVADENTKARVAGIIDRARERNLDRAAELASWATAGEQGRLSADDRSVAADIAHQLAGSAGTFGYLVATDIAREVEGQFANGDGQDHWTHTGKRIGELIARLHEPPELDGNG